MADKATVQSTATIKFMSDGTLDVQLTSPNGVTARKLDLISGILYKRLNDLRAKERHKLHIQATPVSNVTEN